MSKLLKGFIVTTTAVFLTTIIPSLEAYETPKSNAAKAKVNKAEDQAADDAAAAKSKAAAAQADAEEGK